MRICVYTRGYRRHDDYAFVGPENERWWQQIGFWLTSDRPALVVRRRGDQFEAVLCALPTSRKVEDGSRIATTLFLEADAGSDDAVTLSLVAIKWMGAIAEGSTDLSPVAEAVDSVVDEALVALALGSSDADVSDRLGAVRAALAELVSGSERPAATDLPLNGWVSSQEDPEGQSLSRSWLVALATDKTGRWDGVMIAVLNKAMGVEDGFDALRRLDRPAGLLVDGPARTGIRWADPKGRATASAARPTPLPFRGRPLAVAAGGIVAALLIVIAIVVRSP